MTKATERAFNRAVKFVRGRFDKMTPLDRERCAAQVGRVIPSVDQVIVVTDGIMAVTLAPTALPSAVPPVKSNTFNLKLPDAELVASESVADALKRMRAAVKPREGVMVSADEGMLRVRFKAQCADWGECIEAQDAVLLSDWDEAEPVMLNVSLMQGVWSDQMAMRLFKVGTPDAVSKPVAMAGDGFTVWLMPMRY